MDVNALIAALDQHPGHWIVKSGLLQPVTEVRGYAPTESVTLALAPRLSRPGPLSKPLPPRGPRR